MAKMSKKMPLKVFAAKYRWNPKEEEWILKNDKDDHYYNNSALKSAWSSLSYPIYDGDYYFAFIHDNNRINAQYNAQANRELQKYKKSFLNADEIFDKMQDYFKRFKDAGSGDTMTREELWTAIVDMRRKNPAPKKPTNESLQEVSLGDNMLRKDFPNVWASKDAKLYRVLARLISQDGFVDNMKAYKKNPKDYLNRLRNIAKNPKKYEKSFGPNFSQYINNPKPNQHYAKLPEENIEEGKFSKYSDLLMLKARIIDKEGPKSSKLTVVNDAIRTELKKLGIKEDFQEEVRSVLGEAPYDKADVKKVQGLEKKLRNMLKEVDKVMRGSGLSAPAFYNVRSGISKVLQSI